MNKLLSSLGAKICAVILFITTCTCLTASALGIGWLAASGAYADEGDASGRTYSTARPEA